MGVNGGGVGVQYSSLPLASLANSTRVLCKVQTQVSPGGDR